MRAPLEPDAQMLVDRLAAMSAGAPAAAGDGTGPAPLNVEASRQGLATLMMMGSGGPHEVKSVENRTIPGPAGEIPVRVYTPEGTGPFPLVVFFHGGGWTLGSLDTHDAVARQLTKGAEAVVMSVDYRLAPEHPFPAATDDAYAAVLWAGEHADELGADGARLAVAGDSAGGNLSAVTALRIRDQGGPALRFQLLVYPVTDHRMNTQSYDENATGYILTRDSMQAFWSSYCPDLGDRKSPYASPALAEDLSNLPPALVITAGYDPLRDEGEAYAERLREAGVDARASRYDGSVHVFFGMPALFQAADRAMDEACRALREALA